MNFRTKFKEIKIIRNIKFNILIGEKKLIEDSSKGTNTKMEENRINEKQSRNQRKETLTTQEEHEFSVKNAIKDLIKKFEGLEVKLMDNLENSGTH